MRKKLLLIIIVAILAVSIPVTLALLHQGQEPSNGEPAEVPSDTPTDGDEAPATSPTFTMLSITEGDVFVMKAGTDNWIEAQVGMSLESGDIIKSGNGSSAEITFFDGSTIELEADTELEVVSLGISEAGSKTIGLKQVIGTTISRVKKLVDSASSYEIETQACVAVVRGSVMEVNVIDDGTTWVTNKEGDIWVIWDGGELQVPEGRKCIIMSGQPPQLVPISGGGGGGDGGGFSPDRDIAITKVPSVLQAHDGDTITYNYTVTNPGNVALSNVSVTDNRIGVVTYQSGDTNGNDRLDTDETWIYAANYTVTADDISPLVNTAAASGTYAGSRITTWATATVDILRPAIAINKTAEPMEAYVGDTITYTYTVTNTGNTPLSAISVIDDMIEEAEGEVIYQSGDTNGDSILDTDETWIFTATYEIPYGYYGETVTNTATVHGTDALDKPVTAQATASVTITFNIPAYGIRIELSWNTTGTDLDAHLIRPGGQYWVPPDDCNWRNKNPDWGISEVTVDNPSLDIDDLVGYGTETITLEQPFEQGTYHYVVHYYRDNGHGPSLATVNVWINDVWVNEYNKPMSDNDVWHCLSIEWPSGQVTLTEE